MGLIPAPMRVEPRSGECLIGPRTRVVVGTDMAGAAVVARHLNQWLWRATGVASALYQASSCGCSPESRRRNRRTRSFREAQAAFDSLETRPRTIYSAACHEVPRISRAARSPERIAPFIDPPLVCSPAKCTRPSALLAMDRKPDCPTPTKE